MLWGCLGLRGVEVTPPKMMDQVSAVAATSARPAFGRNPLLERTHAAPRGVHTEAKGPKSPGLMQRLGSVRYLANTDTEADIAIGRRRAKGRHLPDYYVPLSPLRHSSAVGRVK
jgi:hypothetical protein